MSNLQKSESGSNRAWVDISYRHIPDVSVKGTDLDFKITANSVARKSYHCDVYNINPIDYGLNQKDLNSIKRLGLLKYLKAGGVEPSDEFIMNLQRFWQEFPTKENVQDLGIKIFMGEPRYIFIEKPSNIILVFDPLIKKSITSYQLSESQFTRLEGEGSIGTKYPTCPI